MPPPVFHADPIADSAVRDIDGMTLLFHRRSGATHFLSEPLPAMLDLLANQPATAPDLAQRLCAQLDLPCDDEAVTVVAARLAELADTGLVWTA